MQMKNCGIIASGSPDPDDADDARCRADPLIMYLCKLGRNSYMQKQMKNLGIIGWEALTRMMPMMRSAWQVQSSRTL